METLPTYKQPLTTKIIHGNYQNQILFPALQPLKSDHWPPLDASKWLAIELPFQLDAGFVAIAVIMCMVIVMPVICSMEEEEMGKEEKDSHRETAVELAAAGGKEVEKEEEEEEGNNCLYTG